MRNFYKEYIYLLANLRETEKMLQLTPSENVIDRMSYMNMKKRLERELLEYEGPMFDFHKEFDYFRKTVYSSLGLKK